MHVETDVFEFDLVIDFHLTELLQLADRLGTQGAFCVRLGVIDPDNVRGNAGRAESTPFLQCGPGKYTPVGVHVAVSVIVRIVLKSEWILFTFWNGAFREKPGNKVGYGPSDADPPHVFSHAELQMRVRSALRVKVDILVRNTQAFDLEGIAHLCIELVRQRQNPCRGRRFAVPGEFS